ncbi:unnamed protein product [Caenorhabditis auriculariae]|uniref:Dynein light chain n=9 Tax=Rhabditida TaxID=6236 RepID=A0A8S1H4J8_9PELO|nr:unnamed protein product [Caenorhabditis auriculariae]
MAGIGLPKVLNLKKDSNFSFEQDVVEFKSDDMRAHHTTPQHLFCLHSPHRHSRVAKRPLAQPRRKRLGCQRWTTRPASFALHSAFCSFRHPTPAAKRTFKMVDRKAVIKNADMSEDMQQDAIDCATQALEKYNIEKDIAAYIKKEFDKKYNPTWHCIVGRNFGSYVTHETKHFIYFYLGQVAILLFKSG